MKFLLYLILLTQLHTLNAQDLTPKIIQDMHSFLDSTNKKKTAQHYSIKLRSFFIFSSDPEFQQFCYWLNTNDQHIRLTVKLLNQLSHHQYKKKSRPEHTQLSHPLWFPKIISRNQEKTPRSLQKKHAYEDKLALEATKRWLQLDKIFHKNSLVYFFCLSSPYLISIFNAKTSLSNLEKQTLK